MARSKYPRQVEQFAKWLFPMINLYDWGFYHTERKHPMPNLIRSHLLFLHSNNYKYASGYRYTRTRLAKHMAREVTHYYRSKFNATHFLLNLDIDAKSGEAKDIEEAKNIAHYIATCIHRGAYYEPSTNGKGQHVYLKVARGNLSCRDWKNLIRKYIRSLRKALEQKGFQGTVDRVCGQCTLYTRKQSGSSYAWSIEEGDFGILSKIPTLPEGDTSFIKLSHAPTFTHKSFQLVINRQTARTLKEKEEQTKKNKRELALDTLQYTLLTRPQNGLSENIEETRKETNAISRMHKACGLYFRINRKLPTDKELQHFYELHNLHTGMDVEDREKRFKRAGVVIRYQKLHQTNHSEVETVFVKSHYMAMVAQNVNHSHFDGVKCDRSITTEDLAIALYVMECNSLLEHSHNSNRYFTCGNKSIISMFQKLKSIGMTERGCNLNKASAMRRILTNSGLISLEDGRYWHLGPQNGICKKFGIGELHPRRDEFVEFKDKVTGGADLSKAGFEQFENFVFEVHPFVEAVPDSAEELVQADKVVAKQFWGPIWKLEITAPPEAVVLEDFVEFDP